MFIFSGDKMQHFPEEYSENASLLTFMNLKESICQYSQCNTVIRVGFSQCSGLKAMETDPG